MKERYLKKLEALLKKMGLEEEKVAAFMAEVTSEDDGENPQGEPQSAGTEQPAENAETEKQAEQTAEQPAEQETAGQAEEPQESKEAGQPAEQTGEQPAEQPSEQPAEQAQAQADALGSGTVAPNQEAGPDAMAELQARNEQLQEALNGLTARLAALEDALRKAGVMRDEDSQPYGFASNSAPAASNEDPMASVLAEINGRRK